MPKSPPIVGGTIYLLCFAQTPYKGARHYLGVTTGPLEARLAAHAGRPEADGTRYGRTSKLLIAARLAGCTWVLADVWEFPTLDRTLKMARRLRRQRNNAKLCSICNPGNVCGHGRRRRRRQPRTAQHAASPTVKQA